MAYKKKSWQEKLADSKDLPRFCEASKSKRGGTGTFVIPAPMDVDALMKKSAAASSPRSRRFERRSPKSTRRRPPAQSRQASSPGSPPTRPTRQSRAAARALLRIGARSKPAANSTRSILAASKTCGLGSRRKDIASLRRESATSSPITSDPSASQSREPNGSWPVSVSIRSLGVRHITRVDRPSRSMPSAI